MNTNRHEGDTMRTGSLINHIADTSAANAKPEVGQGCTEIMWSDRKAATIIEVSKSGHKVTIQYDTATRVDTNGMSDAQEYTYTRNPDGATRVFTRRQDGTYRVQGGTGRLVIGARGHYHDFSF